jgi:hypothetical protein
MTHSNEKARKISIETTETFKKVVSEVETAFGISSIFQRSNSPKYTAPRSAVFYILVKRKGLKSVDICELSGIKSTSQGTYYIKLFDAEHQRSKKFRETIIKLGYE